MPGRSEEPRRLLSIEVPPAVVTIEETKKGTLWNWVMLLMALALQGPSIHGNELQSGVFIRDLDTGEVLHEQGPYDWVVATSFANEWAEAIRQHGVHDAIYRIKNGWRLTEPPPA